MSKGKDPERYFAAIIGTITAIGYGAAMTWTSPSIPFLTSDKSPFPLSKEQCDIISSLLTVGYITGYIMNPFIIENFGSKKTLLLYTIPQTGSWILINISKVPLTLYVARIFAGIGYGAGICALTIYLSEIGTSATRGIFISLLNLSMGLGFFLVMLFGAYIPYHYMNSILLAFPIIFFFTFFFIPDASYFKEQEEPKEQEMLGLNSAEDDKGKMRIEKDLYRKGDFSEKDNVYRKENFYAKEEYLSKRDYGEKNEYCPEGIEPNKDFSNKDFNLKKDFGANKNLGSNKDCDLNKVCDPKKGLDPNKDFDSNKEMDLRSSLLTKNLQNQNLGSEEELKLDRDTKQKERRYFFGIKETRFWKMIACRNSRKALIITISLAAQDVLSGHMVVWTFTQQILTSKGSPIDSEKATMFLAVAKIVASGLSTLIIEKTGRRNILLVTSIIGTMANIMLCGFFYMEERDFDVSSFGFLPCVGLTAYEFFLSTGCANFFYLYQAELFTPEFKSMGVMVCKVSYMAFSYFCLFRFQVLMAAIGKAMIYVIFSILSVIVSIFVMSITPETRGKSNEEIQVVLRKKRFFV